MATPVDESAAILDYAGPRKRSALRLPAVSRLDAAGADGRVTVTESLAGQQNAVGALVFGLIVLGIVIASTTVNAYDFHHHRWHRDWQAMLIAPGVMAAALLACMAGVLQQTWRRTLLSAEYDDLRLAFRSPFRSRHYRWTAAQIADVVVVLTANVETAAPLGEVLITRVAGGEIRLFTDHAAARLGPIARAVHDALREGRTEPLPADVAPPAVAAVADDLLPRAEQTAGRLLDVRRSLRDREPKAAAPPPPTNEDGST